MIRLWTRLVFVLVWLSLWESAETRRTRYKPAPPQKPKQTEKDKAIEKLAPGQNININQMSGKWHLISVASRCKSLIQKGFKLESTTINLNVNGDKVSISTITKLNYECWEIKQNFKTTKTPGHLLLNGRTPSENVDIFVVDTDYSSYAVLVFKKAGKITIKLYGRKGIVPDKVLDAFEDRAKTFDLGLDLVFQFPHYGFCESVDKVLEMP
ncbi:complement component C8 gamma chain [Misgurnus anguillicaudatus]|uniref:complement component C8 gamma chain n=1 Tax=Misgurnus anguillicaudatus TaxID=75329 RepID=UPI002434E98B|nr:complement component C8 gamma chain [Misgurnus anguillicaudatus]